jgi:hypothetical protein
VSRLRTRGAVGLNIFALRSVISCRDTAVPVLPYLFDITVLYGILYDVVHDTCQGSGLKSQHSGGIAKYCGALFLLCVVEFVNL